MFMTDWTGDKRSLIFSQGICDKCKHAFKPEKELASEDGERDTDPDRDHR